MDLGRSGAYNDVSDNTRTFITDQSYSQQRDGERFSNEIEMNERESGAYSRFTGSFKQSLNDHHQGSASVYTGKSIKHDDEHIFETELKTPDSGTYSRNIGSYGDRTTNTYGQSHYNGTIENHDFTGGSKYERRIHENGIHKTQVGSIRDISDTEGRMETHQQRNYDHESQPRSNKFFQPSKYVGNTLDTPCELDEDPPAKSVDFFRQSNPTQPYTSKSKNKGTATSTSDYDGNDAPHWANMMYDTEFTDGYLKQKWPRVNLQSSKYQSSGPFVVQNDDDDSRNEINSNNKNDTGKRTRNTCCVICFGIVLLILVVVPIIVITTLKEDNTVTTEYLRATMSLEVNDSYHIALDDHTSSEYKTFGRQFCSEIATVYTTGSLNNYYGCRVINLMNGSIIVIFEIIFTDTTQEKVTDNVKEALTNGTYDGYWLGKFFIESNTTNIINVITERLTNPPDVQVDDVETSSTPLMLDSSSQMLSQGPSLVMSNDEISDDISSFNQTSTAMKKMEATTTVSESDTTLFLTSATMTVDHTITLSSTPSLPDQTTDVLTDTVSKSFLTTSAETTIQDSISNQITKTYISSQESETMRMSNSFASISTTSETLVQMSTEDQSISTNVVESMSIMGSYKTTSSTYESESNITTFPDDIDMSSTMPQTLSSTRSQESMISTDISTTSLGVTSIDQRSDEESKSILATPSESENIVMSSMSNSTVLNELDSTISLETTNMPISSNKDISSATLPISTATDEMSRDESVIVSTVASIEQTIMTSTMSNSSMIDSDIFTDKTLLTSDILTSLDTVSITPTVTDDFTFGSSNEMTEVRSVSESTIQEQEPMSTPTDSKLSTMVGEITSNTAVQPSNMTDMPSSTNLPTELIESSSETIIDISSQLLDKTPTLTSSIFSTESTPLSVEPTSWTFSSTIPVEMTSSLINDTTEAPTIEPPAKPVLILSVDQVIDLVFNNGVFYRDTGTHTCEGDVRSPSGQLVLDIMYPNGTEFQDIPTNNIVIKRENITTTDSKHMESISFGIKFTEEMDGGKIRCRLLDNLLDNGTVSEELRLIPRNICSCGDSNSKRGHPKRCDVQVHCKEEKGIMYPEGVPCGKAQCRNSVLCRNSINGTKQCRNSINGTCSNNCSPEICNQPVPSDFCIQPPTTPTPSAHISCNDSTADIHSGPVDIVCVLNETMSFSWINISYQTSREANPTLIYRISTNGSGDDLDLADSISVSQVSNNITITVENATCKAGGIYGVTVDMNEITAYADGILTVVYSPRKPILKLNADQVIDLEFDDGVFYRDGRAHTCKGDVGNPPKQLIIEMMYGNQTMFQLVPEADIDILQTLSTRNYCQNNEEIKFGLRFSSQMNGGKVRCRVSGIYDNKTTSDEETMQLIPRNICSCGDGDVKRGHPTRCDVQVHCNADNDIMYPLGVPCGKAQCRNSVLCRNSINGTNQCRNSLNGICSNNCSPEVCNQPVPSDFCTTPTTTLAPSMYISCKDIGAFQYSGPVHIVCNIQNNLDFVGINISKDGDNIAQLDNNHTINPSVINDNVDFSINDTNIIITIDNVTCNDGGVYTVVIIMTNTTASAEARLFINRLPEKPQLVMHPDTIVDLGYYRIDGVHLCKGNVGYPPGMLVVEGKHRDASMYHDIAHIEYVRNTTVSGACSSMQYLSFGISFYPELDHGKIRCRVQNDHYLESNGSISKEFDLVLIPRDICSCAADKSTRGHPGRCDAKVVCVDVSGVIFPYGQLCTNDLCRNSITGVCTTNCSDIICKEEVPSDFCTTVAPSTIASPMTSP